MSRKHKKNKNHHQQPKMSVGQNEPRFSKTTHREVPGKIRDVEGNYDIDGFSQDKDFNVIAASEGRAVPPRSFRELIDRVRSYWRMRTT